MMMTTSTASSSNSNANSLQNLANDIQDPFAMLFIHAKDNATSETAVKSESSSHNNCKNEKNPIDQPALHNPQMHTFVSQQHYQMDPFQQQFNDQMSNGAASMIDPQHQRQHQYQHQQQQQNHHSIDHPSTTRDIAATFSPPLSPLTWAPASPRSSPNFETSSIPTFPHVSIINNGRDTSATDSIGNAGPTLLPKNPFDYNSFFQEITPQHSTASNGNGFVMKDPFLNEFGNNPPISTSNPNASTLVSNNAAVLPNTRHLQQSELLNETNFWADMGFGPNTEATITNNNTIPNSTKNAQTPNFSPSHSSQPIELDHNNLPLGGEYYKARITTAMLGAIFSSGEELRSTLFSSTQADFVNAIESRPVVSFTIDGGAADTAGIGLGHILLSVNGMSVRDTEEAVRLVGSESRPLILEFYIPKDLVVVKTEGQYMVKYDTTSTEVPVTSGEWKGKYVVVGDMLGKPNMLYMYRSKAEYDIAVKEAQKPSRRLSVKVKQFDISHACILHQNGQIRYPNQPSPWYYFTVVRPGASMPIKISAPSPEELKPIYDGIVNFLEKERGRSLEQEHFERRRGKGRTHRETYY